MTLALATYKAARTIAGDEATSFLREPFVEGHAHDGGEEPVDEIKERVGD